MQFTYPNLLWALFLLLIPLLIHLFQLRRFKKTPFTNVRLLQKVVAKSRKSRNLKKWLLLLARLGMLAALVLAFAQPFTAAPTALQAQQNIIYLDDSFSMQARTADGSLLENAVQELLKAIPGEQVFTLFTNDRVFDHVYLRDIRNTLLSLPHTPEQLPLASIYLKAASLFKPAGNTRHNLIVISDFQERMAGGTPDSLANFRKHFVQLTPENLQNASIDSAFISQHGPGSLELTALLSSNSPMEPVPVSLYNADTLIAKTSAIWSEDLQAEVRFSLPAQVPIEGRIEINDLQLSYDNQLYFTLEDKPKISVLGVGGAADLSLDRIFAQDEFAYVAVALENLDYSLIPAQDLIVLNELPAIPTALQKALLSFAEDGGSLVVIPAAQADLGTYNVFLRKLAATSYSDLLAAPMAITSIAFSHPLYANVFEQQVTNFQFPTVAGYFPLQSRLPDILSLQGGVPFLAGSNGTYIFTAPLSGENSNFRNSPLIVPTFYNMGQNSLKLPQLYYRTGARVALDMPVTLGGDRILKVRQQAYEFIPRQQSYTNKTSLTFEDHPDRDGHFVISDGQNTLKTVSFNFQRDESQLRYTDPGQLQANSINDSIANLFDRLEKAGRVTALWKWFVILALLCMLAELLIQKFLK